MAFRKIDPSCWSGGWRCADRHSFQTSWKAVRESRLKNFDESTWKELIADCAELDHIISLYCTQYLSIVCRVARWFIFKQNSPVLVNFVRPMNEIFDIFYGHLAYFVDICFILRQFVIFCWHVLDYPHFGTLHQEKSGNTESVQLTSYRKKFRLFWGWWVHSIHLHRYIPRYICRHLVALCSTKTC
jgi:hypothetical protein